MEKKDPIISLIQLNDQILKLDEIQAWIDHARKVSWANQIVQLELDRCQIDVDRKRELISLTMHDIRSRN